MKFRPNARLCGAAVAMLLVATPAAIARADEAMRWNQLATEVAARAKTDPLTESRWFAMMHLAMHDALNAIEPRYAPWRSGLAPAPGASPEAAVAAAAHGVLVELAPAGRAEFDAALARTLDGVGHGGARALGEATGRSAAAQVLAARRDDGADRKVARPAGTRPGEYRPTPPDHTPAFMAQWPRVRPFALRSAAQFRPAPPPAVSGAEARHDLEVVREIGGQGGTARTAEQDEIARYWYENSTQGWNRITRALVEARRPDLWESARWFALVNVAMADGFIAGFEAKYHFDYWRPVTAIHETGEKEWMPNLWTPPVPDYPSTHTVLGAAAATALARGIGLDFVPFSTTSGGEYPGITRKFWSLSEAAHENGCSRVFAGIHFPTAVAAGLVHGQQVGRWVAESVLAPLGTEVANAAR